MNQRGNFHQNPYSGGVPGWGESPMHQRGPHMGGSAGIWGQRGPQGQGSFEHGRGPAGHSPNPRQSPRGQFSPMYTSSPYIMQQQTPHHQFRGSHRGGKNNSTRFQFSGRKSSSGPFTSSPRQGSHKNGENVDISAYYKHSMVEDPWKDLILTPVSTEAMI